MVFLELFHGRETVDEEMEDFGSQGPVIGPLPFLHTTYGDCLKFGEGMVGLVQGLIFYDGIFYGDWSVISEDLVQATPSLKCRVEAFDETKTTLQLAKAA
jgi:hypothetical protein